MKDFHVWGKMLFTELKNLFSFRSYRYLNFANLGQLFIKKTEKIENWDIVLYCIVKPGVMLGFYFIDRAKGIAMPILYRPTAKAVNLEPDLLLG